MLNIFKTKYRVHCEIPLKGITKTELRKWYWIRWREIPTITIKNFECTKSTYKDYPIAYFTKLEDNNE